MEKYGTFKRAVLEMIDRLFPKENKMRSTALLIFTEVLAIYVKVHGEK